MGGRSRMDVVVLGAGPAGLAAAWRLAARGQSVVVLERANHVGGLAASFEVGGQRVDHGSHRLHPSAAPEVLRGLTELLGDDLQRRTRNGRIRIAGRFVSFPPRPADLIAHFPPSFTARLLRDALTRPLRRARADTFAEVVRATLGPTLADHFYAPYVSKIWGLPPYELAGELARKRVSARGPRDLVARVLRPSPRREFLYPRRGFGEISERLADAAIAAGATIRLGVEATRVAIDANGVVVDGGDGTRVDAEWAFSTLPVSVLARIVSPAPPTDVAAAAATLRSRGLVLVYLQLEQPRFTQFDAHYFPEPDIVSSRISEPKNYRDSSDDPIGCTVLCAELPATAGDERWLTPDADLAATVVDDVARAGLPAVRPAAFVVRRIPHVYPVYDLGYAASLQTVQSWLGSCDRLLAFGRHARFSYDNSHHGIEIGWAAGAALGADGLDSARWEAAVAASREHVVED
jgi:protoporphyrinogen oxidase